MATKADLPAYANYFFPTISVLRQLGGSGTIEEIEDGVAEYMKLSDELLAVPHGRGSRTQFQYELAWVRTYLKRVGAAENSERGVWALTDKGEKLSEEQAKAIVARVRSEDRDKRRTPTTEASADTTEIETEYETATGWVDGLLELLGKITPAAFERLAQRLLRESGFTKVEVLGRAGDGGIDGIGVLRVNLVSFHVLFQCKRWKDSVGAPVVRDFRGAMVGRADKGIIITTGTFSSEARKEAIRDGAPAIDLIDGETLCQLLKERRLGVGVQTVETITLDPSFFDAI